MADRPQDDKERRLLEIRRQAELTGQVADAGIAGAGSAIPQRAASEGYYGLPMLKSPVWTWEIPAYLFVGGAAGASAVIGAVGRSTGASTSLIRDARWIAAIGAAASPPLLISDLGRPERFLNMLRVFKVRSPMSIGAWTLVAFSTTASAAAFADLLHRKTGGRVPVQIVGDAAEALSAATGVVLSTYTGVLIGATAVPAWSHNVRVLPVQFGASGVGAAVSILELLGHRERALNLLGIGAAAVETLVAIVLEARHDVALDPLRHGRSGRMIRVGSTLLGPLPIALRVLGSRSAAARRGAAISTVLGAVLTRVGWIQAGRESTHKPARPLIDRP